MSHHKREGKKPNAPGQENLENTTKAEVRALETPISEEDKPAYGSSKRSRKEIKEKHTNLIAKLGYLVEIISHPGSIIIAGGILTILFIITRYLGALLNSEIIKGISEDIFQILPFIITIVLTHMITKLLENRKRLEKRKELEKRRKLERRKKKEDKK